MGVDLFSELIWTPLHSLHGFFAGKVKIDGLNNLALLAGLLLAIIAAIVLFTKFTKKLNYKRENKNVRANFKRNKINCNQ